MTREYVQPEATAVDDKTTDKPKTREEIQRLLAGSTGYNPETGAADISVRGLSRTYGR